MTFPLLILAFLGIATGAVLVRMVGRWPSWLVAVAAGAGALLLHGLYFDFYVSDDAFISFRYARNWADGLGPVWNPGERVDGYTNFLWTGLLAAAAKLGLALPETASWGGFAAALGVLGTTALFARWWPERSPQGMLQWLPLATVLLLVANGAFSAWTFAGLEMSLFTALVVLSAYLHLREDAGEMRLPWSSLALLGAALTRPEGLLFFAITAAFKLYGWWRADLRGDRAVALLSWAALFVVPFAIYFGWHWLYYGHPLPNSFYAKVGSGMDQYERGLDYVAHFGREYGALLALFTPVVLVAWRERRRETSYVLALLVAWTAYLIYIGGDGLVQRRMFVPILPLFYLLATAGALWLLEALRQHADRVSAAALAGVGFVMVLVVTLHPSSAADALRSESRAMDDREVIGKWLHANVPVDYTIALSTAGAIPYFSELPVIDMLGINDEHIAHADVDLGGFAPGHEKFDSDYVLERAPELIFVTNRLEPAPRCLAEDYEEFGGSLISADRDIVQQPLLFELYITESVELQPGRWFNVLVRNDTDLPGAECEPRIVRVGETVTLGELEVTVRGFRLDEGETMGVPPAGHVWLVVDATVTNVGSAEILVSPFLQTAVEGADGDRYLPAAGLPVARPLRGTVQPGETLQGAVVYAVPVGAGGLQLVFSPVGEIEEGRWVLE